MARSKDPRKTDRWHRGAKRTGDLSPHVLPGDTEENSRDHNRLWDKIAQLSGLIEKVKIQPGDPGDIIVIPPGSEDPSYFDLITGDAPWAWWRHRDLSGTTLVDSSGNSRDLTLNGLGSAVYAQSGIPGVPGGLGIDYNASTYGLRSGPGFDYGEDWTVEGWFNPDALGACGLLGSDSGAFGYTNQWGIRMASDGSLICSLAGPSSTGTVTDPTVQTVNEWFHVAIVVDGDTFTFYVNGEAVGTAGVQSGFNDNTDNIVVGMWDIDSGFFTDSRKFDGVISEVAVYTRALTADEIDDHYRIGAGLGLGDPGDDPTPLPPSEAFADGSIPVVKLEPGTSGQFIRTVSGAAVWVTDQSVSEHVADSDPHTQYQKESEKGAASGYASLDSGTLVPNAQLGSGTPDDTMFLRGDRVWATPPAGGSLSLDDLLDVDTTGVSDGDALVYDSASGDWLAAAIAGGAGGGLPGPRFFVSRATNQSLGSGFQLLTFDSEAVDTDTMFSGPSNDVTIKTAGFWVFGAFLYGVAGPPNLFIQILRNSNLVSGHGPNSSSTGYDFRMTTLGAAVCAVNDVINLQKYSDSSTKNFTGHLWGVLLFT